MTSCASRPERLADARVDCPVPVLNCPRLGDRGVHALTYNARLGSCRCPQVCMPVRREARSGYRSAHLLGVGVERERPRRRAIFPSVRMRCARHVDAEQRCFSAAMECLPGSSSIMAGEHDAVAAHQESVSVRIDVHSVKYGVIFE